MQCSWNWHCLNASLVFLTFLDLISVYEAIIDDERRQNTVGLLMSLNMLIETQAGFDFTGADCRGWMRDAGFNETRVEPLCGPDSMVVGIK